MWIKISALIIFLLGIGYLSWVWRKPEVTLPKSPPKITAPVPTIKDVIPEKIAPLPLKPEKSLGVASPEEPVGAAPTKKFWVDFGTRRNPQGILVNVWKAHIEIDHGTWREELVEYLPDQIRANAKLEELRQIYATKNNL